MRSIHVCNVILAGVALREDLVDYFACMHSFLCMVRLFSGLIKNLYLCFYAPTQPFRGSILAI